MDLALDDELTAVKEMFDAFFAAESTVEVVRAAEPLGFDVSLWQKFCSTGGPTIAVPEQLGGAGASALALTLIAYEAGRRIAPLPIAETFAAAVLAAQVGADDILAEIGSGSIATIALRGPERNTLRLLPAGAVAQIAIGIDRDDLVAWRLPAGRFAAVASNFGATPVADWEIEGLERTVLSSGDGARDAHATAVHLWRLLTGALLCGARRSALEIAVEYVKERDAFGVPIGWFQAIQHRLADVAVAGDGADLLLHEAAWAYDADRPNARALAEMSFAFSTETAFRACRESLQFHGGYGFTLEYDIQLYFRRVKAWPLLDGDPRDSYIRVAEQLYGAQDEAEVR